MQLLMTAIALGLLLVGDLFVMIVLEYNFSIRNQMTYSKQVKHQIVSM